VWLYDAHSGKEIRLLQKHSDRVEVDTGNLITTLSKHNNWVKALTFSSDGKILASGSQDGTVLVWDLNKIMKSQ
ncbi:hypothetical protein F4Z98_14355, partial [Candidatus Poribacteria bacterium]|nr:hypothetical protein [Candidatus Poribacteria bacterium]